MECFEVSPLLRFLPGFRLFPHLSPNPLALTAGPLGLSRACLVSSPDAVCRAGGPDDAPRWAVAPRSHRTHCPRHLATALGLWSPAFEPLSVPRSEAAVQVEVMGCVPWGTRGRDAGPCTVPARSGHCVDGHPTPNPSSGVAHVTPVGIESQVGRWAGRRGMSRRELSPRL